MHRLRYLLALVLLAAAPLRAEVARVVADIAPVHSLVAQVMQGLGEPFLLVPPGVSPHGVSLKPSQARALQEADLVIWIGPELTPWLERPLATLANGALRLTLLDLDATRRLPYRDLDGHRDRGGTGPDRPEGAAAAGQVAADDEHDHHPAGTDPHAWLDPGNALVWLDAIASALAAADPGQAARYRDNAAAAAARLAALAQDIDASLAPMRGRPFVARHDAYQYFERRFGLSLAGTVAAGDAAAPGPARLDALRQRLAAADIRCAFSEPQLNSGLLDAVAPPGLHVAMLDPLGAMLTPGADLYARLLDTMAATFRDCLSR